MNEYGGEINTPEDQPQPFSDPFADQTLFPLAKPTSTLWGDDAQSTQTQQGWFQMPGLPSRLQVPGVELGSTDISPNLTGDRPYGLPISIGGNTFKSNFNFQNPGSSVDALTGFLKTIVPGMDWLGNQLGEIGTNIANSDFGRNISNSPLAPVTGFVGGVAESIVSGLGVVTGDIFSPLGKTLNAIGQGDLGGAIMAASRAPYFGDIQKNNEDRVMKMLHGTPEEAAQAQKQLIDEVSFLGVFLGGATGLVGKGASALLGTEGAAQAGGMVSSVFGSGAAKVAIKSLQLTMAAGYGVETGLEIASHIDPEADAFAKQVSENRIIPNDSPFRGIYDLGMAGLIDPFPALADLASSPTVGHWMVNHAPMPYTAQILFPELKDEAIMQRFENHLVNQLGMERLAQADVQNISRSLHANSVDTVLKELNGDFGYKATTLAKQQLMDLARQFRSSTLQGGKFSLTPESMDLFVKSENEYYTSWGIVENALHEINPETTLNQTTHGLVTQDHLTQADIAKATKVIDDYMTGPKRGTKFGPGDRNQAIRDEIKTIFGDAYELTKRSPDSIRRELASLNSHLPYEPTDGPLGAASERTREMGYKVIKLGSREPLSLGSQVRPGSVVYRDAERINGGPLPSKRQTLESMIEYLNKTGKDGGRLKAWTNSNSVYSKDGLSRPFLTPDPTLTERLPADGHGVSIGNFILGLREFMPNAQLGYQWRQNVFNDFLGKEGPSTATRPLIDKFLRKARDVVTDQGATVITQLQGRNPTVAGQELLKLAESVFGKNVEKDALLDKAGNPVNISYLLAHAAPKDTFKEAMYNLFGGRPGTGVGAVPSFFKSIQVAAGTGQPGNMYRWWTEVGHPMLRYDWSPVFQAQVPIEQGMFAAMRGFLYAPTDPMLREAANAWVKDNLPHIAGRTTGERYVSTDFGERVAMEQSAQAGTAQGAGNINSANITRTKNFIEKQITYDIPMYFASAMKARMPEDWVLLKKQYGDDRSIAIAVLNNRNEIKRFVNGELGADGLLSRAGLQPMAETGKWATGKAELMPIMDVHRYGDFPRGPVDVTKYNAEKAALLQDGFQSPLVMHYHTGTGEAVLADAANRLQMAHELASEGHSQFEYVPVTIRNEPGYIERLKADGITVKKIPGAQLNPGYLGVGSKLHSIPDEISPKELFKDFQPKAAHDVIAAYSVIQNVMREAMDKAGLQATKTMLFNPTRSYWERSLSHPMLVYPLSWTIKAAAEWARFLGHSAFGLPTGMAGLVGWSDIQKATATSLQNDPEGAKYFSTMHPETTAIINFLMPGTPLGLGFGLVAVPPKDLGQIALNLANHADPLANVTSPTRFGLIRDLGGNDSIAWRTLSEWISKKRTSLRTDSTGRQILNP